MKQRKKHNSLIASEELLAQSMKEKRIKVEEILLKYKKSKIQLKCYNSLPMLKSKKAVEKEELIAYISFVDTILSSLSEETKEFFEMEYFLNEYDPLWWKEKYSDHLFFKIRNMAYSEFLMYVS